MGLGTVGSGVYDVIRKDAARIERETGLRLVVRRVAVRSKSKKRAVRVPRQLITTDWRDVVADPGVQVVVELIGGTRPAQDILLEAFRLGKHVVTANKALLAERGDELFREAASAGCEIGFEASVCGGIPIIQAVREGLAANEVRRVLGIVNGTCNYILTAMSEQGQDFRSVLAEAQKKGYAEQNPSLDIDGIDSAHKLAVLARLSFGRKIRYSTISVEGIRGLSAQDIGYAKELGYVVKLLAIGKRAGQDLELRVHPALLPAGHPLATVRGVYNAVYVQSDLAGDQLFYGRGAGMYPTASAVLSDILRIARERVAGAALPARAPEPQEGTVLPVGETASKYYLRFQIADKPGVLGEIARRLGANGISILSVHQKEEHQTRSVPVVILTYEAKEKALRRALAQIDRAKDVVEKTVVMRVEA